MPHKCGVNFVPKKARDVKSIGKLDINKKWFFSPTHMRVVYEQVCGWGVNFIGKLSNYHLKYYFLTIWKFHCRVQNNFMTFTVI